MTGCAFLVQARGTRLVTIREFDPAQHPTQARAQHGNYDRAGAWAEANRQAAARKKHYDPICRKARDIVFVGVDGERKLVKQAEQVSRGDAPKHEYTVTLKIRRTGEERVTVEQGGNKREATDAARARITVGATTLLSCVKGERVGQTPAPVAAAPAVSPTPISTQKGGLPWE